ncbi:glycosyltransferase family 4 protein [Micrococcus sp. 2A]|uniref:glycosyltransferase family 4 protein n=1 Tax=Micrococcus sp. 2A TaxID=3142261 RepID=UPI0031BB6CEC
MREVPWARHAALTAQIVAEHVVDDPLQLLLQGSRRLPAAWRGPLGTLVTTTAGRGSGLGSVAAAVGLEMQGRTAEARARVAGGTGDARPVAAAAVARADAALLLGDAALAAGLLEAVPENGRGTAWHAAAARLALHRGDLDAAVAASDRRGLGDLHERMAGEAAAFAGHRPHVPRPASYAPVPGRVLHVLTNSLPHTGSGYAQRSHSTLRALADAGVHVEAVTRPGWPAQVGVPWAARQDMVDGIHYRRLTPWRLAQGTAARMDQHARLLAAEVDRFRPQALHTTTHFVNAVAVRAVAEAYGIPWVYEVRGQLADTWASKRDAAALTSQRYREFVAREEEAARSADAVVTLGETMAARLRAQGVAPQDITVCPNAIGEAFLAEPPTRAAARRRLGLAEDHVYIGTVSSLVGYEGLDTLLRAAALLMPDHPSLRVSIAGDGVSLPALRSLASDLGIADRVRFPGRVARSEALWEQVSLDVFTVPRRDLPVTRAVTPMKSVEASAVGTPVVASDLPALAELVQDGVTGLLVPAEDPAAWARCLGDLLAEPGRRESLGSAGRAWAVGTRTWEANARRYRDLYERLGVEVPPGRD